MKKQKPLILLISGVAGSGKDSVMEKIWDHPDLYEISVSYTDRPMRPGDIAGKTYNFISKEEFDRAISNKEFIEWEQVRGEYRYGRKKTDFDKLLATGKTIILHIDVLGAQKMKKLYKGAVSIFIIPPSLEEAIRRLEKRGSDQEEAKNVRIDRYELEMSYKNKYDYVIINDSLDKAQTQLFQIIKKEKEKSKKSKFAEVLFFSILSFLVLAVGFGYTYSAYIKSNKVVDSSESAQEQLEAPKEEEIPKETTVEPAVPVTPPAPEVKKKIAANPPKTTTPTSTIAETTTKNSDGSTTTSVSTGGSISSSDLSALQSSSSISSPLDIPYKDETGKYSNLGPILINYLNSALKWKADISYLKQITVRNAGASGWNGQYLGSYNTSPGTGKITSAQGSIILNTYYIETQYCAGSKAFEGCENEYAKYVFSHEYGHHYTLYHKWVAWNLPVGTRFPDSYYNIRPLSKATTTTDYSLGWSNSDVEIIAEDYSYLYSGFGMHLMNGKYGYPSLATKTWLNNIGDQSLLSQVSNNAPTLAITSPAEGATLSGSISFNVDASDDLGIAKISFYVGDKLVGEDNAAPFSISVNTTAFENSQYILKAVASDGSLTTTKTVSVTFENTIVDVTAPTIILTSPATNPYTLVGDKFTVSVEANDDLEIDKIELYFEDQFQQSWDVSKLSLTISLKGFLVGTYTLKFKAYDKSGNTGEVMLTVNKS